MSDMQTMASAMLKNAVDPMARSEALFPQVLAANLAMSTTKMAGETVERQGNYTAKTGKERDALQIPPTPNEGEAPWDPDAWASAVEETTGALDHSLACGKKIQSNAMEISSVVLKLLQPGSLF